VTRPVETAPLDDPRPVEVKPVALVSVLVSFASVQHRPRGTGRVEITQVRTVADPGEHTPADLESVLVATPREFESRILRRPSRENVRAGRAMRPALLASSLSSRPRSSLVTGADQHESGILPSVTN
jgi:hypothetical protein